MGPNSPTNPGQNGPKCVRGVTDWPSWNSPPDSLDSPEMAGPTAGWTHPTPRARGQGYGGLHKLLQTTKDSVSVQ
jgi:hypothetical protein